MEFTDRIRNVLVIDDLRAFQVTLKSMLQNMGVSRIDFCDSGEQALRDIKKFDYDLIVSDYNLGSQRKNGRQLLEELKERKLLPPNTLFVIVTGENTRAMVLGALENQPDDYVMKPFSHQQLRSRLLRAIDKRTELQALYEALARQDYPAAIEICRTQVQNGSRYANYCLCLLAELYCTVGEFAKSEKMLRHFMEERDTTWTRVALARTFVKSGRHAEAEELLTALIKAQPLLLDAHDLLAESYMAQARLDDAIVATRTGAEISPLGIQRQQRLGALAVEKGDFELAHQAFGQVYELSRHSVYHSVDHLCDYVRMLFEASDHAAEDGRKRRLQNEAFTVLQRARASNAYSDFDFNGFEGLCQARLQARHGDLLKAKKTFYKAAAHYMLDNRLDLPDSFLPEGVATLSSIGEYETAIELADRLQAISNRGHFAEIALNDFRKSDDAIEKLSQFEAANRDGIARYTKEDYPGAINAFRLALAAAPTNTGAALNLIQSLLQHNKGKRKAELNDMQECRDTFKLLDGVPLPEKQKQRYHELRQLFDAVSNNRK